MTLGNGFPGHSALATFADVRRDLEGAVVRNAAGVMRAGIFPAHYNALVTGRADMKVSIADFRAVLNRGGAIFLANEGVDITVQLDAAPAANRRIDLIYLTQQSTALADAASTPIFGVVKGTASASPVVPALPPAVAAALPLATVEIPAGATTTLSAGVVITQVYPYTAMAGGTVAVRNSVELAAWTPADGARAFNLADTGEYVRLTTWKPASGGLIAAGTISAQSVIDIDGLTGADRYEIALILPTASVDNDVWAQLRSGGSTDTSANYDRQRLVSSESTTVSGFGLAQTSWVSFVGGNRRQKMITLTLMNLNEVAPTFAEMESGSWNPTANPQRIHDQLRHRASTAFDGVRFAASTGTVTGRYEVRAL